MDWATTRWTPLTEVSVKEGGGGAEGKYKVLTGCGYGIRGWERCGWYKRAVRSYRAMSKRRTSPHGELMIDDDGLMEKLVRNLGSSSTLLM